MIFFPSEDRSSASSARTRGVSRPIGGSCPGAGDKFTQGSCRLSDGQPILVGGDTQALVNQQYAVGAFGTLNCDITTPSGAPSRRMPPGQIPPGVTLTGLVSYSASCCWQAQGIYFSKGFVDFLSSSASAYVVGVYAGSGYGENSVGYGQDNTNLIPMDMLTDPRQNCCPLFSECTVEAGSPYVVQFIIKTFALTSSFSRPIETAVFGVARSCNH